MHMSGGLQQKIEFGSSVWCESCFHSLSMVDSYKQKCFCCKPERQIMRKSEVHNWMTQCKFLTVQLLSDHFFFFSNKISIIFVIVQKHPQTYYNIIAEFVRTRIKDTHSYF